VQKIFVQISDESSMAASIEKIDRKIPDSKKHLPGFNLFYNQIITCIHDFRSQEKKLSKTCTTLHLKKEIVFYDLSILIILDYPKKKNFFGRIKKFIIG